VKLLFPWNKNVTLLFETTSGCAALVFALSSNTLTVVSRFVIEFAVDLLLIRTRESGDPEPP
jgi:hypothetical protein